MFLEQDIMVKKEQFRDYQRQAERDRLLPSRRPATQVVLGLLRWIERLAGSIGLDRSRVQPIYRSEETTAL